MVINPDPVINNNATYTVIVAYDEDNFKTHDGHDVHGGCMVGPGRFGLGLTWPAGRGRHGRGVGWSRGPRRAARWQSAGPPLAERSRAAARRPSYGRPEPPMAPLARATPNAAKP